MIYTDHLESYQFYKGQDVTEIGLELMTITEKLKVLFPEMEILPYSVITNPRNFELTKERILIVDNFIKNMLIV